MKNIELTEKHKSKLLEICVKLFKKESEINSIQNFRISNDYVLGLSDHTLYCENRDISDNQYDGEEVPEDELLDFYTYPINCFEINMHWFEFCITEIVNELAWRNIKTDILADCEYEDFRMKLITEIFRDKFTTEKFHIVDYLYKKFKKLK